MNVGDRQLRQLLAPHPRRVERLQDRAVPHAASRREVGLGQDLLDLGDREDLRRPARRDLRQLELGGGVGEEIAVLGEPPEETLHGRELLGLRPHAERLIASALRLPPEVEEPALVALQDRLRHVACLRDAPLLRPKDEGPEGALAVLDVGLGEAARLQGLDPRKAQRGHPQRVLRGEEGPGLPLASGRHQKPPLSRRIITAP